MASFILGVRDKIMGRDAFGGRMGSISYLKVPDGAKEPQPSHRISGGVSQWLKEIVNHANPPAAKKWLDVVFFVHGYNTDAKEALVRQRQVGAELLKRNFPCMVIGFDWPTAGNAAMYSYDRFEAQSAASCLVKGGIIPFARFTLKPGTHRRTPASKCFARMRSRMTSMSSMRCWLEGLTYKIPVAVQSQWVAAYQDSLYRTLSCIHLKSSVS